MWVASLNAIVQGLIAVGHYFSTMPASHAILWTTGGYFLVLTAPEKLPVTPQDFWSWFRNASQGYVSTKVPHPTQPAPTVPEQPKLTQ